MPKFNILEPNPLFKWLLENKTLPLTPLVDYNITTIKMNMSRHTDKRLLNPSKNNVQIVFIVMRTFLSDFTFSACDKVPCHRKTCLILIITNDI